MSTRMAVVLAASTLVGTASLAVSGAELARPCGRSEAPLKMETRCLTAVQIPGKALLSFDISWVKRNAAGAVNNNISGPDGVTSHGRWLYAGDGDSTLHVIDLEAPAQSATQQIVSTGGTTRVDEMALTDDGSLLLAANNAEDPPFGTLLAANGDAGVSRVYPITKITVDPAIVPAGFGLSIEQPAWEPKSQRFYVSIPVIANNPAGCNYGQLIGAITCHGGLLVIDPATLTAASAILGAFDPGTKTGVLKLSGCGPNGATVGPHGNLLVGCTPQNNPSDTSTLVINAKTGHFGSVGAITGSDEVWFNAGDQRYYTGSSRACGLPGGCPAPLGGAVLGVIDAQTNLLIETIPQSQNSHSVAADSKLNRIYVPQVRPFRWSVSAVTPRPWARKFAAATKDASPSTCMWATRIPTTTMETSITEVGYCHCSISGPSVRAR